MASSHARVARSPSSKAGKAKDAEPETRAEETEAAEADSDELTRLADLLGRVLFHPAEFMAPRLRVVNISGRFCRLHPRLVPIFIVSPVIAAFTHFCPFWAHRGAFVLLLLLLDAPTVSLLVLDGSSNRTLAHSRAMEEILSQTKHRQKLEQELGSLAWLVFFV